MTTKNDHHFLLIACPGQGHINPTLQLAKCIARSGLHVTFATAANALRQINIPSNLDRLSLASFSTGFDDGVKPSDDPKHVAAEFKRVMSTSIHNLIISSSNQGRPISLLIYTLMMPFAADVARELHVPSAFLCIQSATSFAIYNSYFNGRNCPGDDHKQSPQSCMELSDTPTVEINTIEQEMKHKVGQRILIEGLPVFEPHDLPTFLLPSSPHHFVLPTFEDHIRALEQDPNPTVLVNSFDALEEPAIRAVDRMKIFTIGPLIPSAYSDMRDPSDKSYGCDLFERSNMDYLSWLGSKEEKSVVYVSFGSMVVMKRKLFEEILHGLILTGRPYLWVLRPTTHHKMKEDEDEVVIDDIMKDGLGPFGGPKDQGLIIPWCSQVEVLSNPAIGCFLTHCGWNSILESLVMGVPVVGVPLISDQTTNAKMVEEVWRVGLRAKANEEGVVDKEEVRRCVEVVMGGDKANAGGEEIGRNSKKWMELALEAIKVGGSSNNNFERFLECQQNSYLRQEIVERKLSNEEGIL